MLLSLGSCEKPPAPPLQALQESDETAEQLADAHDALQRQALEIETRTALMDQKLAEMEQALREQENAEMRSSLEALKQQNEELRQQADEARRRSEAVSPTYVAPMVETVVEEPTTDARFETELAPYGRWLVLNDYGRCWRPAITVPNWRPYVDGCWEWSSMGWTWQSNEPFGGIVYHYGRWVNVRVHGWVWVPGHDWAPAWVAWRQSSDYVGWAPLPPDRGAFAGVYRDCDSSYGLGPSNYVFITLNHFIQPSYTAVCAPVTRNTGIFQRSVNVTQIVRQGGQAHGRVFVHHGGPPRVQIEQACARPAPEARPVDRPRLMWHPRGDSRPDRADRLQAPVIAERPAGRPPAVEIRPALSPSPRQEIPPAPEAGRTMGEERERRGPMISQSRHSERRDPPSHSGPEPQSADAEPSPVQSQPESPANQQPAPTDAGTVAGTPPGEARGQMHRPDRQTPEMRQPDAALSIADPQTDQARGARTQERPSREVENDTRRPAGAGAARQTAAEDAVRDHSRQQSQADAQIPLPTGQPPGQPPEEMAQRQTEPAAQSQAAAPQETGKEAAQAPKMQPLQAGAEAARLAAEQQASQQQEMAQRQAAEEARLRTEAEAARVQEMQQRQAEAEAARLAAQQQASQQQEMAQRQAAEEARQRAAAEAAQAQEMQQRQVEALAAQQRAQEEAARAEAMLQQSQTEERARREQEMAAQRQAEEQARQTQEMAQRQAQEEARRQAEAEMRRAQEAAQRQAEEQARQTQEMAQRQAEEQTRRAAEEQARRAQEEAARAAQEAARNQPSGS